MIQDVVEWIQEVAERIQEVVDGSKRWWSDPRGGGVDPRGGEWIQEVVAVDPKSVLPSGHSVKLCSQTRLSNG